MNHSSRFLPARRRHGRGVGIVTAIFLLVVLSGLGVALVTLFTSQRQAMLLDEQGVRALQAARAGIEWGLYHRLRPGDETCADGGTYTVALAGDVLGQFTVSVFCRKVTGPTSTDADVNLDRWLIRATACAPAAAGVCLPNSSNPDYVRRVIEVQI